MACFYPNPLVLVVLLSGIEGSHGVTHRANFSGNIRTFPRKIWFQINAVILRDEA